MRLFPLVTEYAVKVHSSQKLKSCTLKNDTHNLNVSALGALPRLFILRLQGRAPYTFFLGIGRLPNDKA